MGEKEFEKFLKEKKHTFITKESIDMKKIPTKDFAEKLHYPVKVLASYRESQVEKHASIASKEDLIELSKKAYITVYTGKGKNRRVNTVMGDHVISCKKLASDLIL